MKRTKQEVIEKIYEKLELLETIENKLLNNGDDLLFRNNLDLLKEKCDKQTKIIDDLKSQLRTAREKIKSLEFRLSYTQRYSDYMRKQFISVCEEEGKEDELKIY